MNRKYASLIGALLGLVIMVAMLPSVYKSARIKSKGAKVEGTVTSIGEKLGRKSELRKITVTFITAEGNRIEATASKRKSVQQGDVIAVWYDKSDPKKIYLGDSIGYNLRPVFIGGIFFIICLPFFIRAFRDDKAGKKLVKTGMKVSAELVGIERNEEYRMGQNNPWFFKCRWTDRRNNKEYIFLSSNYVVDPASFLGGRRSFDVYIDPDNPLKYYMDQSSLPQDKTIGPVIKLWS